MVQRRLYREQELTSPTPGRNRILTTLAILYNQITCRIQQMRSSQAITTRIGAVFADAQYHGLTPCIRAQAHEVAHFLDEERIALPALVSCAPGVKNKHQPMTRSVSWKQRPCLTRAALSERDICTKFITPVQRQAGWDEMLQIREEVTFTKGRIIVRGKLVACGKTKRADYILYYKPNIPIAVIEAKDNSKS